MYDMHFSLPLNGYQVPTPDTEIDRSVLGGKADFK